MSGRLVAMMSLVRPSESKPSIWFNNYGTPISLWFNLCGEDSYLHKRPLNLTIRTRALREPATANGVYFVHEDDARLVVARVAEHLTHDARGLADVLVDDRGGDYLEEVGLERRGDGAREEGLACAWGPVEEDALGGLDADSGEEFGVH